MLEIEVPNVEMPTLDAIKNETPLADVQFSDDEEIVTAELTSKNENEPKTTDSVELYSDEEEEEEISSEGQDYDSESSVDDSDLLKRLDEKYGKLPRASDDDEIEEDIDPTWTST